MQVVDTPLRRAPLSEWEATILIMGVGEFGYASDIKVLKIGDGVNLWPDLPVLMDLSAMPGVVDVYVDSSEAGMLSHDATSGDVSIRTDISRTFAYDGDEWLELAHPTDAVLSVQGRTGTVTLSDLYEALGAVAAHEAAANPHSQYVRSANLAASITALTALGFYGKTPIAQRPALTAASGGTATTTAILIGGTAAGANTVAIVNNHTVRIGEIEATLKAYGLLP